MKFREHRGNLAESMETMVEFQDKQALVAHLRYLLRPFNFRVEDKDVAARLYSTSGDQRIGWEKVYVVTVHGYGVVGFSDSPIEPEQGTVSGRPRGGAKGRGRRRP
jgi:hypothetical protein